MGVAHFLAERRLRTDWPELGGVGVDCTELVLVEPAFTTSAIDQLLPKGGGWRQVRKKYGENFLNSYGADRDKWKNF